MDEQGKDQRPRLTGKQRAFVDHWFGDANFNGTKAARLAGYQGDDNYLAVAASRLIRNDKVSQEIAYRFSQHGMGAEEVIARLAQQGRGNIGEFLTYSETRGWYLDMAKVQSAGHLVKSLQWTQFGPKIMLYDAQGALQLVGKHLGLFKDQVEHTGKDGAPIQATVVVLPDNERGDGPVATEGADE